MTAQRYGLLGWPVKHSVSPEMQGAGFRAAGIDATYELIEVPPEKLTDQVEQMKAEGFCGWNITVPHKLAMMELVDEVDPAARIAGSVNTVINRDGHLSAYSTDGYGLARSIQESFDVGLTGGHFLFWGAGGAARATSVHFALEDARMLTIVNRTRSKAVELAETIRQEAPDCIVSVLEPTDMELLREIIPEVDVLIQSTSIGLHADDPIAVPEELLIPELQIVDMIYRKTRLLSRAAELGCKAVDGKGMLLYQGVRSFELWTGLEDGPTEAMREGLNKALEQ